MTADSFRNQQQPAYRPLALPICVCPGSGQRLQCPVPSRSAMLRGQEWSLRRQGLRAVRAGQVAVVDGHQMFNRPGPRLVDGLEWLVGLLHGHPEVMPPAFPWVMLHDLDQPQPAATAPGVGCHDCNHHQHQALHLDRCVCSLHAAMRSRWCSSFARRCATEAVLLRTSDNAWPATSGMPAEILKPP